MTPAAPAAALYTAVADEVLQVLHTTNFSLAQGCINTDDATLLAHIRHNIRLGHPQVKAQAVQLDRVALVGSGPSLPATERALVDLLHGGAKLVTMNGAYQWALQHNLRPSAQVILDARATNARFLDPPVPGCRYLLSSQCHPDTFAAAADRDTWIFHTAGADPTVKAILDTYYLTRWHGVAGGTTVFTRALTMLRMLGFLRFDVFGVDSCWLDGAHHAVPQPENETDLRLHVRVEPEGGGPETARVFTCSPWHIKQFEDVLQLIRVNGQHFLLNVHGDGLIAFMLRSSAASVTIDEEPV